MKKPQLSGFDLGVIIAFAVLTLLGIGGWWYLSGQLQTAVGNAQTAKANFDRYAIKNRIVVSSNNSKSLQSNINILRAQLEPLIESTLHPKDNKLSLTAKEDPVAWKHDLDDQVRSLTSTAQAHSVDLPKNFYFGFGRYQSQSPNDEQTRVLGKQLLGVHELATILINAPVNGIQAIRRTYEEEPRTASQPSARDMNTDPDRILGFSIISAGNVYTAYPFEVEFETTPENLRVVLDSLIQSNYLFVVRTLVIHNKSPNSPSVADLDKMAGGVGFSASGAPSTKGPQFLFGNSTLSVKARIDMIEWDAEIPANVAGTTPSK